MSVGIYFLGLYVKIYTFQTSLKGGTKVYINGPGHMTKMAAMAINSKNL